MNPAWRLGEPTMPFPDALGRRQNILLEYDGPVMMTLMKDAALYFAMAVDEDDAVVRWIQAPISDLELDAIKLGAEPLRRAFMKDRLLIVDYSQSERRPVHMWEVPRDAVPDDVLPTRDAFFPRSRKRQESSSLEPVLPDEAPESSARSFRLAGNAGPGHSAVTFGELSAVARSLQELWNAFAQGFQGQPTTLAATAFGTGSLRVHVYTDQPVLFDRIATQYRDLVLVSDDPAALGRALGTMEPRVGSTYKEYLETVDNFGVEVLAEWRQSSVFVGPATAKLVRASYPKVTTAVPGQTRKRDTARIRGCFQGFLRTRGFEFLDLDTGKRYQGTNSKALKQSMATEFDLELGRGSKKRYLAEVRITRTGDTEKYELLDFQEYMPLFQPRAP